MGKQVKPSRGPLISPLDERREISPSDAVPIPIRRVTKNVVDDRQGIKEGERVILIVEDDPQFAKILYGMCRERGFKCLLASDGESGVADAAEFRPNAIILDLRLPGISGLTVLAGLKNNLRTRHIPIHVISVEDKSSEVLKMGAMGFLSKPVDKAQLDEALKRIEQQILAKNRRVLVVEDKKTEREAIQNLIGDGVVKSMGAESGGEALKLLRTESFDCMILDLHLGDMTGFELLSRMEEDETLSRPPVVVYTGKDLSKEELEKLEKFSQSIIIKGAKSEERLFDEVTLFLHRVSSDLSMEKQQLLERVRHREEVFEDKKLLIVDDDMRNVFALRSLLGGRGFEILTGKTGKEGIEILEKYPDVDIVLMDIMMPEMDGYEAMRAIRLQKKFGNLPVIALTAKAMKGDREKCFAAGASDYLSKPIDPDNLLSLLRVWLTRK